MRMPNRPLSRGGWVGQAHRVIKRCPLRESRLMDSTIRGSRTPSCRQLDFPIAPLCNIVVFASLLAAGRTRGGACSYRAPLPPRPDRKHERRCHQMTLHPVPPLIYKAEERPALQVFSETKPSSARHMSCSSRLAKIRVPLGCHRRASSTFEHPSDHMRVAPSGAPSHRASLRQLQPAAEALLRRLPCLLRLEHR